MEITNYRILITERHSDYNGNFIIGRRPFNYHLCSSGFRGFFRGKCYCGRPGRRRRLKIFCVFLLLWYRIVYKRNYLWKIRFEAYRYFIYVSFCNHYVYNGCIEKRIFNVGFMGIERALFVDAVVYLLIQKKNRKLKIVQTLEKKWDKLIFSAEFSSHWLPIANHTTYINAIRSTIFFRTDTTSHKLQFVSYGNTKDAV